MPPVVSNAASATGPRFLAPVLASKVKDSTSKRYRSALREFLSFCIFHHFTFATADELDDLLVEWHHSSPAVTKAKMESAVAAAEHILPHFKHHLPWARAVLAAWAVVHVARRTVPLCREPCCLVAAHLAAAGHPKLGAGLVIQQALGLRPSELVGLWAGDIMLPED